MKKRIAIIGVGVAALTLAGCGSNNFRDVEGVQSHDPDSIENFNNMDGHPNIGKVCIHGVAFATTTRDFTSILRVPEWDKTCPVK